MLRVPSPVQFIDVSINPGLVKLEIKITQANNKKKRVDDSSNQISQELNSGTINIYYSQSSLTDRINI